MGFKIDYNDPPQRWFWDWSGDLDDDCTAVGHGLMLRAEQMNKRTWWWAVYEGEDGRGEQIAANYDARELHARTGAEARTRAEQAARNFLAGV